jgi:hypothetical protein
MTSQIAATHKARQALKATMSPLFFSRHSAGDVTGRSQSSIEHPSRVGKQDWGQLRIYVIC